MLFSSVITLVLTLMQLYKEYRYDLSLIDSRFEQIAASNLDSINESVWTFNETTLKLNLSGLQRLPDIAYLEVTAPDQKVLAKVGDDNTKNIIVRQFQLEYLYLGKKQQLGTLKVVASLDNVYGRLLDTALIILLTQAIKTFFVSIFIIVLFQSLVTRHLGKFAEYLKQLNINASYKPYVLERKENSLTRQDELDQLTSSFNVMHQNLFHAYESLELTQDSLKAAQSMAHMGSCIWSVESNRIVSSDSLAQLLGVDQEQAALSSISELFLFVHQDDRDLVEAKLREAIHSPAKVGGVYRMLHKDGGVRIVALQAQQWKHKGAHTPHLLCTWLDITESKQKEAEALELKERVAQASKMESIGHLTAGIAHDFNNMLGAMMGYTELTKTMLQAGRLDKVSAYQDEIILAGSRAKELILQMLTFSRLNPGSAEESKAVTPLSPIVKEVVALLRSSIPSTVEINYRIDDEDLKVQSQPVHLHQIILNLGVNARDAVGEYGKIDISVSRYQRHQQVCSACKEIFSGDYAKITVKDNGSGIPEQVLNKIFDPFFTTKSVGKGTGMGLSVVHGLVHGMGGHVFVESSPEEGTAFNIFLPMLESSVPQILEVDAVVEAPKLSGVRIMVIDDERAITNILQDYLSSAGANVITLNDSKAALEAYTNNVENIDLVITDESMPGISGMLLAEKMLKINPKLAIILCTGYSEHASAETAEKIGIRGFFYKPFNMHDLLLKIQDLMKVQY
jgi:PAS domain S-box-containing protein